MEDCKQITLPEWTKTRAEKNRKKDELADPPKNRPDMNTDRNFTCQTVQRLDRIIRNIQTYDRILENCQGNPNRGMWDFCYYIEPEYLHLRLLAACHCIQPDCTHVASNLPTRRSRELQFKQFADDFLVIQTPTTEELEASTMGWNVNQPGTPPTDAEQPSHSDRCATGIDMKTDCKPKNFLTFLQIVRITMIIFH